MLIGGGGHDTIDHAGGKGKVLGNPLVQRRISTLDEGQDHFLRHIAIVLHVGA
jgi:hypothetical protein